MATCEVGDDVFGDDFTVIGLEKRVAAMFDLESALFFPTGTMANLAAVMSWCTNRGSEMILGDNCHIYMYEQGGSAFLGGVASRAVPNQEDGTMRLEDIVAAFRSDNVHFPVTQLVCVEQTHNMCGGRVLPEGYIQAVAEEVHARGVRLHVDGARIWNAAASTGQRVAEVAAGADSVSVCLSKGLGAPAGSVLVGPADFIARARRCRKALGGGMRQVGVLAAAAMVALDDFEEGSMLRADHARAQRLAQSLTTMRGFRVELETVQTNILIVHIDSACTTANPSFSPAFVEAQLGEKGLHLLAISPTALRIATHRDITDACVDALIEGFQELSDSLLA